MTNKTRSITVLVVGFLSFVAMCWMVQNPPRPTGMKWRSPEVVAVDEPVNVESEGEIRAAEIVVEPVLIAAKPEGPGAARRRPAAVSEAVKPLPQSSDTNRNEYVPLQREHAVRSVSVDGNIESVRKPNRYVSKRERAAAKETYEFE